MSTATDTFSQQLDGEAGELFLSPTRMNEWMNQSTPKFCLSQISFHRSKNRIPSAKTNSNESFFCKNRDGFVFTPDITCWEREHQADLPFGVRERKEGTRRSCETRPEKQLKEKEKEEMEETERQTQPPTIGLQLVFPKGTISHAGWRQTFAFHGKFEEEGPL